MRRVGRPGPQGGAQVFFLAQSQSASASPSTLRLSQSDLSEQLDTLLNSRGQDLRTPQARQELVDIHELLCGAFSADVQRHVGPGHMSEQAVDGLARLRTTKGFKIVRAWRVRPCEAGEQGR